MLAALVWVFTCVKRVIIVIISPSDGSIELVEVDLAVHLGNLTLTTLSLVALTTLVTLTMVLMLLILQPLSLLLIGLPMWKILRVKLSTRTILEATLHAIASAKSIIKTRATKVLRHWWTH